MDRHCEYHRRGAELLDQDEEEENWESWSDWQLRGAQQPPPYEHPPEYAFQCEARTAKKNRKRKRRRSGRGREAGNATAAQADGLPAYDQDERTQYDGDDGEHGAAETSFNFSSLLPCSVPSSQVTVPYSTFREGGETRPCPGQPGDVVAINRIRYEHIVVNVGDDFVVHKCNGEGLILCQKFGVVAGEDDAYVKNSFDHCWEPFAPEEIVQRAYSKVQRKEGYSTVFGNCEHFANWCRYGRQRSGQVDAAVGTIARSAKDNSKKMAGAGAENGLAVGTTLGMVAGGVVGSVLGKVRELITEEPDVSWEGTRIERRTDDHGTVTTRIQQVNRKSFTQSGQVVGGLIGGALGLIGGVVGGGLIGLVSGIGEGTSAVAHRHGVELSQMSAQMSSSSNLEMEIDN